MIAGTTIRRDRLLAIVCLSAVVVFSVSLLGQRAASLPFWYDELLTVRLSQLDSVGELWRALTSGFEFTPPLGYLATKVSRSLPGPETLTLRVPALLGFVLLSVTLFVFLARRVGPWFALSAVALLPLAPYTVTYAVEARPYMLLLGVSGCALVFWQATIDTEGRAGRAALAPAALAISVALALLLHVWAVLLPLALAAGELVASARTRRMRWRVVVALAAATPVIALYPALLSASRTVVFGGPVYEPSLQRLHAALSSNVPRLRVLLGAALAAIVVGWWHRRRTGSDAATSGGFRPEELAVIAALLFSPLVPYVYAEIGRGAFMSRYAMYALPGIICLAGAAMHKLAVGGRLAGQCAAAVTLLGVLLYLPPKVTLADPQHGLMSNLAWAYDTLDRSVPIVLVNPVDVLPFDEQASDEQRVRTVFVADPQRALEETGTNGIDLGYVRGEPYLKLRTRRLSYEALVAEHSRLYLAGKWQALSWLPQRLARDGWKLTQIGGSAQVPVFEGTRPDATRGETTRLDTTRPDTTRLVRAGSLDPACTLRPFPHVPVGEVVGHELVPAFGPVAVGPEVERRRIARWRRVNELAHRGRRIEELDAEACGHSAEPRLNPGAGRQDHIGFEALEEPPDGAFAGSELQGVGHEHDHEPSSVRGHVLRKPLQFDLGLRRRGSLLAAPYCPRANARPQAPPRHRTEAGLEILFLLREDRVELGRRQWRLRQAPCEALCARRVESRRGGLPRRQRRERAPDLPDPETAPDVLDQAHQPHVFVPDPVRFDGHVEVIGASVGTQHGAECRCLVAGGPEVVPEKKEHHGPRAQPAADFQVPVPLQKRRPPAHAVADDAAGDGARPERFLEERTERSLPWQLTCLDHAVADQEDIGPLVGNLGTANAERVDFDERGAELVEHVGLTDERGARRGECVEFPSVLAAVGFLHVLADVPKPHGRLDRRHGEQCRRGCREQLEAGRPAAEPGDGERERRGGREERRGRAAERRHAERETLDPERRQKHGKRENRPACGRRLRAPASRCEAPADRPVDERVRGEEAQRGRTLRPPQAVRDDQREQCQPGRYRERGADRNRHARQDILPVCPRTSAECEERGSRDDRGSREHRELVRLGSAGDPCEERDVRSSKHNQVDNRERPARDETMRHCGPILSQRLAVPPERQSARTRSTLQYNFFVAVTVPGSTPKWKPAMLQRASL
jgi:hypothetical protein